MIVYGVCEMALLPWLYELALCCFSLILKRRNSSAKVAFSSKEISFECLSWDGNTMHRSSAESKRQNIGWSRITCGRILGGKMAMAAFLSIDAFGLVSFHWVEYTLQPSRFQSLVGDLSVKAVLHWLYKQAMCCLSLRWQRRISHGKSDLSSQEKIFGVAFKPSELPAPSYFSERMSLHIDLWAILPGNV